MLQTRFYSNERRLDDQEQYSRSNCLILHGCQDFPPKESNNQVFENYVINKINTKLDLETPVTAQDVDICHLLSSKKKKNPIIIKFVRRTLRNKVFSLKSKLKSSDPHEKLSITESLTQRRLKLIEEARKVFQFRNVWTVNGSVYCFFDGKKHLIDDFNDISKIRFPQRQ